MPCHVLMASAKLPPSPRHLSPKPIAVTGWLWPCPLARRRLLLGVHQEVDGAEAHRPRSWAALDANVGRGGEGVV